MVQPCPKPHNHAVRIGERGKRSITISFPRFLVPLIVLLAVFCASCGLDDYPFLYPIPQANVRTEMNTSAIVDLSRYDSSNINFSYFAIFYRIFVSDMDQLAPSAGNFSVINPTLAHNFNTVLPHIDNDTSTANMDNLFRNMRFRHLVFANADINGVLNSSFFDRPLEDRKLHFDFGSSQQNPVMRLGNDEYILMRSNGNGSFSPRPADRLFRNTVELRSAANINDQFNADVADKANIAEALRLHTYAAMFIVAVGFNPQTLSEFYSTPALIHVFQLPN